jgi:sporulation protein YlmC with PRC-barrel domain
MREEQLKGKGVIDAEAAFLGYVEDVEFEIAGWKTTHIGVKLVDAGIEALGLKKPRLGSVVVNVPVSTVKAVKDVISLDRSVRDLKSVVERRP